jgi:hypothetical protein
MPDTMQMAERRTTEATRGTSSHCAHFEELLRSSSLTITSFAVTLVALEGSIPPDLFAMTTRSTSKTDEERKVKSERVQKEIEERKEFIKGLKVDVEGEEPVLRECTAKMSVLLATMSTVKSKAAIVEMGHSAASLFRVVLPEDAKNALDCCQSFAAVAYVIDEKGHLTGEKVREFDGVSRNVVLAATRDAIRWCMRKCNEALRKKTIIASSPTCGRGGERGAAAAPAGPQYRAPALPQYSEADPLRSLLEVLPIVEAAPAGTGEALMRMAFVGSAASWVEEALDLKGAELWAYFLEVATGKPVAR